MTAVVRSETQGWVGAHVGHSRLLRKLWHGVMVESEQRRDGIRLSIKRSLWLLVENRLYQARKEAQATSLL